MLAMKANLSAEHLLHGSLEAACAMQIKHRSMTASQP